MCWIHEALTLTGKNLSDKNNSIHKAFYNSARRYGQRVWTSDPGHGTFGYWALKEHTQGNTSSFPGETEYRAQAIWYGGKKKNMIQPIIPSQALCLVGKWPPPRPITLQCLRLTAAAQWPGRAYVWRMHQAPSRWDGAWTQTLLLSETEILKHRALVSVCGVFQKVSSLMGGQPECNLT